MKKLILLILLFASPAWCATYYVATTGSNTTGTGAIGAPWQTLTYAESQLSDGDTVVVRGGTYNEYFIINVPNVTFQEYTGETVIIDGAWQLPASTHVLTSNSLAYRGMIDIYAVGVTVDGFEIMQSTGRGITVSSSGDNSTIKNCSIHDIDRQCLAVVSGAEGVVVEDCDIYKGAAIVQYCSTPYSASVCRAEGWGDPPTAAIVGVGNNNVTVRRCKIHDSYNEGINFGQLSTNSILEYCEIYGNGKLQLYICNADNMTARYNLIYGVNTNANGRSGTAIGLYINNESQWSDADCGGHSIYGNFIANTDSLFSIAGLPGRTVSNVLAYNNTLVSGRAYSVVVNSGTGSGHIFKNNIIWGGATSAPASLVTADYNLWSSAPDTDLRGANDPAYALPSLHKTSGWSSITTLTATDFALQSGSAAIDVGETIGATYDDTLDAEQTTFTSSYTLLDQDSYGSGWDIGADIYTGSAVVSSAEIIPVGFGTELDIKNTGGTLTITLTDAIFDEDIDSDSSEATALASAINSAFGGLITVTYSNFTLIDSNTLEITIAAQPSFDITTTLTVIIVLPAICTNAGAAITCNSFYISAIIPASVASGVGYSSTGKQVLYSPTGREWRYLGE